METPFADGFGGRVRVMELHSRLGPLSRFLLAVLGVAVALLVLALALLLIPVVLAVGLVVLAVAVIRRKLASIGRPSGARRDGRSNVRVIGPR
jgi:hypothetical protein